MFRVGFTQSLQAGDASPEQGDEERLGKNKGTVINQERMKQRDDESPITGALSSALLRPSSGYLRENECLQNTEPALKQLNVPDDVIIDCQERRQEDWIKRRANKVEVTWIVIPSQSEQALPVSVIFLAVPATK